ncbi:hypothetical protein [Thiothrix sp.]|jgi:hypothetical protein|uniref:hypothetical protein n=1 Tax=Thiothrix sp. TaxID=1032 RepID=UPI0025794696|nr:hypothetical protein [Thiothrix sp.]
MKIIADGLFFKVAKITGPTHNFLGFEFTYTVTDPIFEDMNSKTSGSTANAVKDVIMTALNEVSVENPINGQLYLKTILFDGGDTPDKDTYKELIIVLTEYVGSNVK